MKTVMPHASHSRASQAQEILSLKTLAAAVCSVLGLGLAPHIHAASTITKDGHTGTTVAPVTAGAATVFTVTTNTTNTSGTTAFNSFSAFNLGSGDTVKLVLPSNTTNLVNLVWNSQAVIDGTVTSYLHGGTTTIGGAVYFADPYGIVVGKDGVLNVGALSLSAPTTDFMNSLLDSSGNVNPNAAAVTTLMQGQEALAETSSGAPCLICVDGTINATNAVRIRATSIDVSGTIYVTGTGTDTLGTAVNVEGSSTPTLVTDGNTIRLDAEDTHTATVGDANANTSITVEGTLQTGSVAQAGSPVAGVASASSWGEVSLTASATSSSAYSNPTQAAALNSTGNLLLDQNNFFQNGINATITDANLAAQDKAGQLAYVRSFSTANVAVSGNITAGGDVVLQSTTSTSATTDATSEGANGSIPVMMTGMYGAVYSKADTSVASGASITSGGQLSVQSSTNNTLNVAANTVATNSSNVAATTVAWSQAAIDSEANVDGSVNAGSIDIGAHNTNSFTTSASAMASNSTGSVGLAGAISLQTVEANASLGSSPTTKGNITVASESDTTTNSTSASTGTDSADQSQSTQGDSDADMTATMAGKSQSSSSGQSFSGSLPFKLGSSIAWTDSDNIVTATVGNGVNINTAGNLAVQAIVSDAGIHNAATSATASQEDSGTENGGSASGNDVNVAAAVTYGDYQHEADAEIGSDANITAANIGVGSQVIVPFDWTFGQSGDFSSLTTMGNSLSDFITGAESIPGLVTTAKSAPDIISNAATSYASASATGAQVDIGGSVNYFSMNNTNRAWIGDGTTLTSTATAASTPGNDSWQSTLDWNTSPTVWAHSISVTANTEIASFNLVGDITPWVSSTEGDAAAIGGAFNYGGYENSTNAGVGSGATLTSTNDIGVTANSTDTLFVLTPVSGKGGTGSLQGTLAITDVDDHTHATLSASDNVTARALDVAATNPLMVWSLSGALAMSNSASVGISVGINNLTTDTLASIGNNSADETIVAPDQTTAPTAPTGLIETGGTFKVASLSVLGSSSGEAGALSVAGSSVSDPDNSSESSDGSSDQAASSGSGSGLLSMLQSVQSVADKLRGGTDKLSSALGKIDELTGAQTGGTSLLDEASDKLQTISSGDQTLQSVVGKVTSLGANKGSSSTPGESEEKPTFGIGISGAASVNMAQLNSNSVLQGFTLDNTAPSSVTVQAINSAQLTSVAGGAALTRTKGSSGGGDLAGAVAYSSVADTTSATVVDSTLSNASNVAVQALDGSEQVDIGVGVAVQSGGSGTSATLAGSVSIGTSANQTNASITDSTLNGGTGATNSLEVTAYDNASIGVGAGSLDVNTGSGNSVNGSLGFTYVDIANQTNASVSGHTGGSSAYDISHYDTLTLRALDASLIGAGVATGSVNPNGYGLTGAFIWNQIGNSTTASIDDGTRIQTSGAMLVEANAVDASDPSVSSLNSLIDAPASASGYDFAGSGLAYSGSGGSGSGTADSSQPGSASLDTSGYGSSIIAVAGDISVGKNNVGLSFVGSQIENTHSVSIGDADLDVGGALGLQAQDNTRIISLAVGGGVSTGQFAGMGSATYNNVSNQDSVLLGAQVAAGDSANITASSVSAQASDSSAIYSLAGNVAIGTGNAAAGGAVTYNNIANTIETQASATQFNTGSGALALDATDNATMMTGAVAAGGAEGTALMLSFGWNQTGNSTNATLENSTVTAGSLDVQAANTSTIESLSGSVGIGGTAAVGLAASIGDIGDNTTATLQDSGLNIANSATVQATGSGTQYALAVAGSFGGDGAGAGSVSYNTITGATSASASQLYGLTEGTAALASSLDVNASDSAAISSLSGGLGFSGSVGVGAAVSVSTIGGSTSASLNDSLLDISQSTQVSVTSTSSINTLSIGGAVGGDVAVSGSNTTNAITNTLSASMVDDSSSDGSTGAAVNSSNATTVSATNNASINALAGAVAVGGSAAVGAAVAVNQMGTTTTASFSGGIDAPTYKVGQLLVSAGAGNPNAQSGSSASNINTIAVGAAGGGDVGVAGSVAVNVMSGSTNASIEQNANVIANDNVGVLASNSQGIDVLAGAASFGGTAGIGVGVVINSIQGSTSAGIYNSNVTAYGNDTALGVDSGTLANGNTLNNSVAITSSTPAFLSNPSTYVAPDLTDTQVQIHGVAVNASNQQYIATLGTGASLSGTASITALAGINDVGGSTTATIQNADINQADLVSGNSGNGHVDGDNYTFANTDQQLDVRATSSQYESNLVADLAVSGTAAVDGALATNVFNAQTQASLVGSTTSSQDATTVQANGNQWSLAGAMGAAASGEVGGTASAAVTVFNGSTDAWVDGGNVNANTLNVLANSTTSGSQIGGALGIGIGTAGIAGTALVNVDSSETSATVEDGAAINVAGTANVNATNTNGGQDIAVTGAAGAYAGISGSAVVNVIDDSTHASIDNSTFTAGSVDVSGLDTQSLNAYSGVIGAGLVGVGGGINLSLLQASVGAGLLDSHVTATSGDVDVSATSARSLTSVAASAGVGAVGVGLSAGVVVAGSGDINDGGNSNALGNLNASGQVNLGNLSSLSSGSRVDSNVSDYGLDSSQLSSTQVSQINSDSSFSLSNATGSTAATFGASDGVQATVSGGTVTASNAVSITAGVTNSTSNTAGAFAGGVAAVGGALAVTTLNSDVASTVASNTTVNAGNGVTIGASSANGTSGNAAQTNAMAGVGGLVGVSAAVAVSVVNNTVQAQDNGTIDASTSGQGTLSINAGDSSGTAAGNTNISNLSLGGIVAGAVVIDAQRNSTVLASIGGNTATTGFSTVDLTANDSGTVSAQGVMGAGGMVAAVDGVVATASDNSQVTASVGQSATVDAGTTSITASASPDATANAEGITIAGGAGIGANVASASVDNTVQATVGEDAILSGGNLGVTAQITPTVSATTSGGAGAALLGVNAAASTATDTSTVLAGVGNDVTLPSGNVMIDALSTTQQTSSAQSITVGGVLAVGAADATSTSTVSTTASLGDGNGTAAATSGNVAIFATGSDTNDASSEAGSGGLIAGNAALATTGSTSTTSATLGQNLDLENLANFSLTATHTATYGGSANSVNAAAVGGSGANVTNTATSYTNASVGAGSTVDAQGDIYIASQSLFGSDGNNGGATGGAGGIISGEAAGVDSTLAAYNTTTLGTGVVLQAGLNPTQDPIGNLTILSDTVTNPIDDQASLSVYGAVPIANAVVDLTGTFNSDLEIGGNSVLGSLGRVDIATYANIQKIGNEASANTGGIATVGTANATATLASTQTVNIGDGVNIAGVGEVDIVAGKDILNSADTELDPSAVAQAYVRGLIAIPQAAATATTASTASLTLGANSHVIGGGDVAIGSMPGTNLIQVDGTGHGYELGFIPATQSSNTQSSTSSANTTINGTVLAGQYNTIDININQNGVVSYAGSTAPLQYITYNANCSTANGAQSGCFNPTTYLNTYRGDPAGTTYSGFDDQNTGAFILGGSLLQQGGITYGSDLLVSGGNVYLYGSSIGGNGTITANGAPSITINNASTDYLILPGMQVGFGSTGTVFVSGGADSSHIGDITLNQTPSSAQPSITVNSTYPVGEGFTPGVVFLNEVDNLGGSFNVDVAAGSLILAPVMVNSQNINVPNGGVSFDHPDQNWFSGDDPTSALADSTSWLNNFLNNVISSPDQTAAAIANAVYGNGATNANELNNNLVNYNENIPGVQKTPIVLYGYCAPYTNGGADGCGGGTTLLDDKSVPTVPYVALSQSGNFTNTANSSGSYQTQTLSVTADYININSVIDVGTPATWTVQTTAALSTWISNFTGTTTTAIPTMDANGNPLLQVIGANSQLIGASYDPTTKQILLNNINASGGGQAYFNGDIVSTGGGSINVNSGFGKVDVDNTTGDALVVNNIYTGSGGLGLITLVDNLYTNSSGTPKTTWYVSQNGGAAVEYNNSNGATTWQNGALAGSVTAATTYQPLAGEEYVWSASTDVNREGGSSDWSWGSAGNGTAGQHWTLSAGTFVNSGGSGYQDLNGNDYIATLSGSFTDSTQTDVWYHGCGNSLGSGCHYGTSATGNDPSDQSGNYHSEWDYLYPTAGTLNVDVAQRADMPIAIGFSTSQSNSVDISSNSNILLNGVISNTNPPSTTGQPDTLIQATNGGSIVQNSTDALIWTHDLTMTTQGGGSIGTSADPIQTRIVHDSTPGSALIANTDGGDIYINVDSGNSAQAINLIAYNSTTDLYGNVSITGTGSLIGIAGEARDVIGSNVSLLSTLGGIGTSSDPLNIETHTQTLYNGSIDDGTLNAQALDDIDLVDHGGDVWVGSIVSTAGNVSLAAPDGGIYDARLLTPSTTLSSTQAEAIWTRLGLNSSSSAQGIANALQNQVDAAYTQYWQLLAVGSVSNGVYTLNSTSVALYWPLAAAANNINPSSVTDPAQQAAYVQAYVQQRYDSITTLFSTYVGSTWQSDSDFTAQNKSFSFVIAPTSALYTSLLDNSQWSADQLTYAINIAALAQPSGAQVGTVSPNISGNNITLTAGDGGIGKTADPIDINYQDFKNLYSSGTASTTLQNDIEALGMANAPGDVQLLDASGNVLQPSNPNAEANLATISIAQTNPLYVAATGALSGSASQSLYLQADGDLNLGGLSSGADMRLAATGNINAAAGSSLTSAVLTTGGNLVINAGGGHISFGDGSGSAIGDALPVQIAGTLLSGSATTDLLLNQLNGNLDVDSVFANGTAWLTASNGSILAQQAGLNISANDITLDATGDIGSRVSVTTGVDAPLQVQVGTSGILDAGAGGMVYITSPQNALQVGTITSGGDLTVSAVQSALTAAQLTSTNGAITASAGTDGDIQNAQAAGDIALTAAGSLNAGTVNSSNGQVTLDAATGMTLQSITATNGNITATLSGSALPVLELGSNGSMLAGGSVTVNSSGALTMDAGSSITGGGAVALTSSGDMQLGYVLGNATTGNAIALDAGGQIQGNGATLNLQALQGGDVSLLAVNNIGSAVQPIVVEVNTVSGSSTEGNVWLHALGDVDVTRFTSTLGSLDFTAQGTLTYGTLQSGTSSTVGAMNIDGAQLSAGTTASLISTDATAVTSVTTGSDLAIAAGTTLNASTLTSGGNASLTSGSDMTLGQVNASGQLTAQSGADLDAIALTSGAAMSLNAAQDSSVNMLAAGGALDWQSGGDATLVQGNVGGTSTIGAGGMLTLDNLQGTGNVATQSGADTQIGQLVVTLGSLQSKAQGNLDVTQSIDVQHGNATLNSGAATNVVLATTSGDLTASAGTNFTSTTLQIGGNGSLTSGAMMTLGQTTSGGNLAAQSGGDLQSNLLQVGGNGALTAGGAMSLTGATTTVGTLTLLANGPLSFTSINAGGNVYGQSYAAGIDGNSVVSGGSIQFIAAGDIDIGNLNAAVDIGLQSGGSVTTQVADAGHDVDVTAADNVSMGQTQAGNAVSVNAGGALTVGEMTAGHAISLAAQQIGFNRLSAPDSITLLARDGSILGATLTTRDAFVAASDDIGLDAAYIGDRINLQATDITANITQTTRNQPLYSVLTGYQGGVAQRITVDANASQQWMIDRLSAVQAALITTAPRADIASGYIEQTMSLDTADARVRMNQQDPQLVPADVQLMQPTYGFVLYQDYNHTLTDAFVIRYSYGFAIETPNYVITHATLDPEYLGESALRNNGRDLQQQDDSSDDSSSSSKIPAWIRQDDNKLIQPPSSGVAVNIKAPE